MNKRTGRGKTLLVFALLGCVLAIGPASAQAQSTKYPFGTSPGGRALVAHLRDVPNLGIA
jgi:hypothetical protein